MVLSKAEWAIVGGALLILGAIIGPAVWSVYRANYRAMVRADMAMLTDAGQRFFAEYGVWPCRDIHEPGDRRFGGKAPNREVIGILRSVQTEGGGDEINVNHLVFLEPLPYRPGRSGINAAGEFLDPWGTPYQIVLDTDLNAVCDILDSAHGAGIQRGMVVWSCGPDRISDTADDILSWE